MANLEQTQSVLGTPPPARPAPANSRSAPEWSASQPHNPARKLLIPAHRPQTSAHNPQYRAHKTKTAPDGFNKSQLPEQVKWQKVGDTDFFVLDIDGGLIEDALLGLDDDGTATFFDNWCTG